MNYIKCVMKLLGKSFDEEVSLLMLDIIIKNSSGPRTVPCGTTPIKTGLSLFIPHGIRT